jgi:hypothetical protein
VGRGCRSIGGEHATTAGSYVGEGGVAGHSECVRLMCEMRQVPRELTHSCRCGFRAKTGRHEQSENLPLSLQRVREPIVTIDTNCSEAVSVAPDAVTTDCPCRTSPLFLLVGDQ